MMENSRPSWNDLVQLVADLDGSDFDHVAVQYEDVSIRMSRGDLPTETAAAPAATAASPVPAAPMAPTTAAPPTPEPAGPAAPTVADIPQASAPAAPAPRGTAVPSPMVGLFYRSPSPGAAPFVSEGDAVTADSTIGIIEVMKLMNPVTAGLAGTVSGFAVGDAQAVEFGEDLLYIIPEGS